MQQIEDYEKKENSLIIIIVKTVESRDNSQLPMKLTVDEGSNKYHWEVVDDEG